MKDQTTAQLAKAAQFQQTLELHTRNILSVYYGASLADMQYGLTWYSQANQIAEHLAEQYGVPCCVAAGVIAVTSPQKEWSQNVKLAEKLIANHVAGIPAAVTGGHTGDSIRKAAAILELANPTAEDIATICYGKGANKVAAFYRNIWGDENGVCVDGHAFNIAQNGAVRRSIVEVKSIATGTYNRIADAYRKAAEAAGITPAQMQAVTWVAYRQLPIIK